MKPILFNIQKFCLHDGPGIRTTVFFKGCPLHCAWCANPESQLFFPQITYHDKNCHQCGLCVSVCPNKALSLIHDKVVMDHQKCKHCLLCANACPFKAMQIEGYTKDIEEILNEILKDADFYKESNGGVTFSGGEVLSQVEAAIELADKLHEHNIHVAIETTGYSSKETFCKLLNHIDLLLFDFKHPDSIKHKKGTGVSNELILENLRLAKEHGKKILIRMPIIPNYNDSLEDAKHTAQIFHELDINDIELLPFHQFGENKYQFLQKEYAYLNNVQLTKKDLQYLIEYYESEGFNVKCN